MRMSRRAALIMPPKPKIWIASGFPGINGSIIVNEPSSETNPTLLTISDPRPFSQSGSLGITLIYPFALVPWENKLVFDWAHSRGGNYYLNLYINGVDIAVTASWARRVDTYYFFSNPNLEISYVRTGDPNGTVWGQLTIYGIYLNDVKIL